MGEMKSLTLNDKVYDSFVDPVARALAGASAVIKSASGESIALSDASEGKPYRFSLYGKTTQNGTPSPDAPVDLVSAGSGGSITVTVTGKNEAKRVVFDTPNGLPGFKVTSGGNYTDSNGQQWVCDKIDLANGAYAHRVGVVSKKISEYRLDAISLQNGLFQIQDFKVMGSSPVMSNLFVEGDTYTVNHTISTKRGDNVNVYFTYNEYPTIEELISAKGEDVLTVMYVLDEPAETQLPLEVLAAFDTMSTYRDQTTIANDANAGMELEYVIDIRKYIDSQISSAILAATVE